MSVLQTIDLKKYYGTEPNITRALDGVNFSVDDGEFVAVVGTSGSGKSTLLHMMGGLDTPTSGTVIVRGEELAKKNDEQLTIFRRRKRSMKTDKRSKAFLLLTIALSVCMIFSIILISAGAQEEFKNTQRSKAQIAILGITDDQLSSLRQNKDVQWIGEYAAIGLS